MDIYGKIFRFYSVKIFYIFYKFDVNNKICYLMWFLKIYLLKGVLKKFYKVVIFEFNVFIYWIFNVVCGDFLKDGEGKWFFIECSDYCVGFI